MQAGWEPRSGDVAPELCPPSCNGTGLMLGREAWKARAGGMRPGKQKGPPAAGGRITAPISPAGNLNASGAASKPGCSPLSLGGLGVSWHACACACVRVQVSLRACAHEGAAGWRARRGQVRSPTRRPLSQGGAETDASPCLSRPGLAPFCCPAQCPACVTHQQPGLEDEPGSLWGALFWQFPRPAV